MLKQSDFKQDSDLYSLSLGPISIKGISIAGVQTHISVPELKISFDVGFSHPSICHHKQYFITHAHMDHAAGIPYIISNKALNKQKNCIFYVVDQDVKQGLNDIMSIWSRLEGHDYHWDIRVLEAQDSLIINRDWKVKPFATTHRVNSQGYSLFQTKSVLKKEFAGLEPKQLVEIKKQGTDIEETLEERFFSFTGDTTLDFLAKTPEVFKSRYLAIECTYASEVKSIEDCREWGHIHLDELIPQLDNFEGDRVILKHFSRRHQFSEIIEILDNKLGHDKELRDKILVLPF